MDIDAIKQALVDEAHYNDSLAISVHASAWLKELVEEVDRLSMENGRLQANQNDALGRQVGDTCILCNWLERGDCHRQKEDLRAEVELLQDVQEAMMSLLADELGMPADDFPAMLAEIQQREIQRKRLSSATP